MSQNIQTAAVRHVDIEQYKIPLVFAQLVQCLVAAGGFSDGIYAGIGLEKLLEPGPNHRMIVSDQYSRHVA
jgi:hypothetical protein